MHDGKEMTGEACGTGGCCGGNCGGDCGCGNYGGAWMMKKRWGAKRAVKTLLFLAGIVYLILLARNAWKQYDYIGRPTASRDTISIQGEGKVTAVPDIAQVTIGVQTMNASVAVAQKENTDKMNAIIAKLKSFGIVDKDIQTSNYSVYPQYDYANNRQTLTGYQVNQSVDVKIRDLSKIGDILAAAGQLGANTVSGVSFTIDDPESLKQQARLKALENAKEKAQALAQAAGVRLGKVVGFSESVNAPGPIFYAKDMALGMGGAAPAAPAPQIQAGSQDIVIDVTVQYEIL